MTDDVKTALIAAVVALVVALIGLVGAHLASRTQRRNQSEQIKAEGERQRELLAEQFRLQEERLRTELRTEFMAETAIQELLNGKFDQRSFAVIKKRVGGFGDDELRQLLVRSGAVRFYRKRDGVEMWGLRTRNLEAADSDDDGQPPSTE